MANATQTYKKSFAGSVGAGMGSLIGGGNKTYYVLEHKVSSKYHKAGEAQEIIVDQVELGRDSNCAVQFDESFKTVSRRHAAIVRDGDNWKLIQLSQTNTTFLNGHPIKNEWYLQNGDEIQLSVNGPKLGFIIPQNNKVGTIGLSRRLSAFLQQALKPYKTAMWSMAACMVLLICAGFGWAVFDHKSDLEYRQVTEQQMQEAEQRFEGTLEAEKSQRVALEKQLRTLKADLKKLKDKNTDKVIEPQKVSPSGSSNTSLAQCEPNVYFVLIKKIVVTYEGETKTLNNVGSGTGFLLNDGRFITARHVVEPWMYPSGPDDTNNLICNVIANNGGEVVCHLEAYSPTGKHLSLVSTNAVINRRSDEAMDYEGAVIRLPSQGSNDYAYFCTGETGGLKYDEALSNSLPVQTKLTVLGYPMGIGANSPTDIHPIYSEAVVAREGLEHGYILTTATTFEHGNSGGPVFASTQNNELIVVGIVSAGAGRSTGMVVPISAVK